VSGDPIENEMIDDLRFGQDLPASGKGVRISDLRSSASCK
jgi:hypothetical protein